MLLSNLISIFDLRREREKENLSCYVEWVSRLMSDSM